MRRRLIGQRLIAVRWPTALSIADECRTACGRARASSSPAAIARLEHAEADPVEAVHDARKHLKKTRALLRLVRPALGSEGLPRARTRAARRRRSRCRARATPTCSSRPRRPRRALRRPAAGGRSTRLRGALAAEAARRRAAARAELAAVDRRAARRRARASTRGRCDGRRLGRACSPASRAPTRAGARRSPSREPSRRPSTCTPGASARRTSGTTQRLLTPAWPGVLGAQARRRTR